FRCTECHSTLLPGSYKGNNSGALVCTHHLSRHTSASQNGRPDLSKKPEEVQSARTGRSAAPFPALSERDEAKTPSPSDEGEGEIEEETQAEEASNGDLPPPSDSEAAEASRPVPAPRRVSEVTPPPRPAPRVRVSCTAAGKFLRQDPSALKITGEHLKPPTPPKPRERSQSPGSGTHKPKDPPWLALVQSETKRKKAPPPPPPGVATPPNSGSLSSLQAEGSGPGTPANPFEDEDDEVDEEEGSDGGTAPPAVAATHPWYSITHPGSAKSKKRPAPRVPPQPPTGNQVSTPSHSQPSSCSPSPALSIESLSSSSDHSSSQLPLGASSDQEQSFGKSVSEPSISLPGDNPSPSSSADLLNHSSQSSSPSALPPNASSAPATPQSSRNTGAKPPRPTTTPSPLTTQAHNKTDTSPGTCSIKSQVQKFCKENPFNRKASPSNAKSETRPSKGPRPARPPAPGHGFPLIKRKVQSDQYIPVEDIHAELLQLEKQLDELEQRGVELEKKLRDTPNDEDEERLLVDWFTLIHDKHHLVRREAELVYTAKQQNLEERQADVEYELRCLLNKPAEKDWTEEDKSREQELMAELVTIIEQRNQIVNSMDQERQREEEEDKLMEAMLKKKDFHKDPDSDHQKKKGTKFKPIKVLKRLSHKGDAGKSHSPRKDKS
uniref:MICAL-like 1a n=1 Tax=Poecilia formosa TaxID=48698 RepID=A0A096LSN6_POEFO